MSSSRNPWRTAAVALLALTACHRAGLKPSPGVVVEALGAQGAGAQAGLRAGDILLSWQRPAAPPANAGEAEGNFSSCTDVAEMEAEEAPRGPVELRVQRGGVIVRTPGGDVDATLGSQLERIRAALLGEDASG